MDKVTYLKNKEMQKNALEEKFQREEFCYTCFKQVKHCLCSHIEPFDPFFEFVILIHPMEAKREKMGTGRLTHAFLKKSKLITGVDFSENVEVNEMIKNHKCFVMYPGDDALNISNDDISSLESMKNHNEKVVIFLIDGTWPCAKKMMKLSTNLHMVPRISFNVEKESMFAIKEQPSKYCLSTIESIHLFLSECERREIIELNDKHQKMLTAFQAMIDFQIKCASDPSLNTYRRKSSKNGYTLPSERKPSKKWESRSIVFKGK